MILLPVPKTKHCASVFWVSTHYHIKHHLVAADATVNPRLCIQTDKVGGLQFEVCSSSTLFYFFETSNKVSKLALVRSPV